MSDDFYQSKKWKRLRERVLLKWPNVCMKCKSKEDLCVDHVRPRSIFPSLALSFSNMGILCKSCNEKKSARIEPDYRPKRIIYYFNFIKVIRLLLSVCLSVAFVLFLYLLSNSNSDLADLPLASRAQFELIALARRFHISP